MVALLVFTAVVWSSVAHQLWLCDSLGPVCVTDGSQGAPAPLPHPDAAQGSAAFATPTFPSSGCDIGAASTEGASSSRPARHGATREFMQLPRPQGELGRMSYNSSPARLRADSTDDR